MSWEAYIDSLKGPDSSGTCPVEEAAIWGNNPMSVWATTPGLSSITVNNTHTHTHTALGPDVSSDNKFRAERNSVKCLWVVSLSAHCTNFLL